MATAYIIRYGRANAGIGPGIIDPPSVSGLLDEVCELGSPVEVDAVDSNDGGSIEFVVDIPDETAGSGKEAMASSPDDVSTVMCFVGCELLR